MIGIVCKVAVECIGFILRPIVLAFVVFVASVLTTSLPARPVRTALGSSHKETSQVALLEAEVEGFGRARDGIGISDKMRLGKQSLRRVAFWVYRSSAEYDRVTQRCI